MWPSFPIESHVEQLLKAELAQEGETLWASYVQTKRSMCSEILPYIATQEPNLSDHGSDHIQNVIKNVERILVLSPEYNTQNPPPRSYYSSKEKLILLLGCVLHDIGNIAGRKRHNQMTDKIWREGGAASYDQWSAADRRTIISVCKAHTGKSHDGSENTLEPLKLDTHYFSGVSVRVSELAAILRFADELAEGPQRTSRYLLQKEKFEAQSLIYHQYASCTDVSIDRLGNRIALNYNINLNDRFFGEWPADTKIKLGEFLNFVYSRIGKLEKERIFARHYAPEALAFNETSVSIHIEKDHEELCPINPITIKDFDGQHARDPSAIDESYKIETILEAIDNFELEETDD